MFSVLRSGRRTSPNPRPSTSSICFRRRQQFLCVHRGFGFQAKNGLLSEVVGLKKMNLMPFRFPEYISEARSERIDVVRPSSRLALPQIGRSLRRRPARRWAITTGNLLGIWTTSRPAYSDRRHPPGRHPIAHHQLCLFQPPYFHRSWQKKIHGGHKDRRVRLSPTTRPPASSAGFCSAPRTSGVGGEEP